MSDIEIDERVKCCIVCGLDYSGIGPDPSLMDKANFAWCVTDARVIVACGVVCKRCVRTLETRVYGAPHSHGLRDWPLDWSVGPVRSHPLGPVGTLSLICFLLTSYRIVNDDIAKRIGAFAWWAGQIDHPPDSCSMRVPG